MLSEVLEQSAVDFNFQAAHDTFMPTRCRALWEAARPAEERVSPAEGGVAGSSQLWHERWGDRCQQIVWIGIDMDEGQLRLMLDGCLLSDEEMVGGPEAWAQLEDPLPPWAEEEDEITEEGLLITLPMQ